MLDTSNHIVLTLKPSLRSIGFGFFGTLFFGAFVYVILSREWTVAEGTDYRTGMILIWTVLALFIFFSLGSLWTILTIKTVVLTNRALIIKKPLLFLKKTVPISNIRQVRESPFKINPSHRGGSTLNVYEGKQILIECFEGKDVLLNSFEISEYYSLVAEINRILRNRRNNFDNNNEFDNNMKLQNETQGYGWLIFIGLLTIGLIYSLIKQRL